MSSQSGQFGPLISSEEIAARIKTVARDLDRLYGQQELVIIAVMKGAICLAADLLRALENPHVTLECIQASSYGKRGTQRGELSVNTSTSLSIAGKHVLLIDDILDSGRTLTTLCQHLQAEHPLSLKTLVLLSKQMPRQDSVTPDYVLFSIEDLFVVGYGLDYKERYRGLNGIYIFKGDL